MAGRYTRETSSIPPVGQLYDSYTPHEWHARERGISAYRRGLKINECPYTGWFETNQRAAWGGGWSAAKQEAKAAADKERADRLHAVKMAGSGPRRLSLSRYTKLLK